MFEIVPDINPEIAEHARQILAQEKLRREAEHKEWERRERYIQLCCDASLCPNCGKVLAEIHPFWTYARKTLKCEWCTFIYQLYVSSETGTGRWRLK